MKFGLNKKEFIVYCYLFPIKIYREYKYIWDVKEYNDSFNVDTVPCDIKFISKIFACNKIEAIKLAKKKLREKCKLIKI
ncbi:MAG: hypothetical protein ACTSRP_20250 [Candidatus Helarchaeota archaeon]